MKRNYIIPIFVPHRGCPNDCIFCNQKKISGQVNPMDGDKVEKTIEEYLATIPQKEDRKIEVAYYGGSFTGIPLDEQKELLLPAKMALERGLIQGIRLSTRPDYIDEKILVNLARYKVSTIELGVQSLNQEVLEISQRGHTVDVVFRAVEQIKEKGFKLGIQLMVGLPGDSSFFQTVNEIIALKPDFVRIYPTLVIRGTVLAEMYQSGSYQPLTLSQAVELCKRAVQSFDEAGIPVIRLGLQTTQEIREKGEVIAGPYHPAFRELVESALIRDKMTILLAEYSDDQGELLIYVHPAKLSSTVGQKKENIAFLQRNYGFKKIRVLADENLNPNKIDIRFRKK